MTTLLFDTLKLSKTLQENGRFTPEQANALAEGISSASLNSLAGSEDVKLLAARMDSLATKDDLHGVKEGLKEDIHGVRDELHAGENRMLRWILGAGAFQVIAVIIALYLHK